MLVHHSYDQRFPMVMERLRKHYGERIFEIEGIGEKDLDINAFSKAYFGDDAATADKTIDDNSNVDDTSVVTWEKESVKSVFKLNSLYMMWRTTTQMYNIKRANRLLEGEIAGWYRINDLFRWNLPYSYYQETPVTIRVNGGHPLSITMKALFDSYVEFVQVKPNMEVIDTTKVFKELKYHRRTPIEVTSGVQGKFKPGDEFTAHIRQNHNIEVLDHDGSWTPLNRVLRHKRHNDLLLLQTNEGDMMIVTEDHPVIMDDGTEKQACQVEMGDAIAAGAAPVETKDIINVPDEMAYLAGFVVGDGNVSRHLFYQDSVNLTGESLAIRMSEPFNQVTVYQKDVKNSRAYAYFKKLLPDMFVSEMPDRFTARSLRLNLTFTNLFGLNYADSSLTKTMPVNFLTWDESSRRQLLAGLLDAEGTVLSNTSCSIRVASLSVILQTADLLKSLGIRGFMREAGPSVNFRMMGINFYPPKWLFDMCDKLKGREWRERVDSADHNVRDNRICKIINITKDCKTAGKTPKGNTTEWVYDITTGSSTFRLGGIKAHNCIAVDLQPLVHMGMPFYPKIDIGEIKHFDSFIDVSAQYVCYASNQFAGAIALPNWFVYLEYFIRKDEGEKWYDNKEVVAHVKQRMQSFIYCLNFNWRSNQSPFTNLSVMDRCWLEALFKDHTNPDYSHPNFDNLMRVQKMFVEELVRNLAKKPFTFPVMTACLLYERPGKKFCDEEFAKWVADVTAETGLFNIYQDDSTASLSSCCRLRNDLDKVKEYTNSFGVGGVSVGSHRVVALNLPNIAYLTGDWDAFKKLLACRVEMAHDILDAHRATLQKLIDSGRLPLYKHKFVFLNRQFSTLGHIGLHEALELLGFDITTKEGAAKADEIHDIMNALNDKRAKKTGNMYNLEQIPGESAAISLAKKDAIQFETAKYDIYSNQYIPLWKDATVTERIVAQGQFDKKSGGGSILHLNIQDKMTPKQVMKLMLFAAEKGVVYFAVNYLHVMCKSCGRIYIGKKGMTVSDCHQAPLDKYMRVVGYLTNVSTWGKGRRKEFSKRVFYGGDSPLD